MPRWRAWQTRFGHTSASTSTIWSGTNEVERAAGEEEEIERIVDRLEPVAALLVGQREAGGGGRREDEAPAGLALAHVADEFQRDEDLAHAHGVDPRAAAAAQAIADALGIDGEALAEFVAVFAARDHAAHEPGQEGDEDERVEEIVEEAQELHAREMR